MEQLYYFYLYKQVALGVYRYDNSLGYPIGVSQLPTTNHKLQSTHYNCGTCLSASATSSAGYS
jgi:hypothetical protein